MQKGGEELLDLDDDERRVCRETCKKKPKKGGWRRTQNQKGPRRGKKGDPEN